MRIIIGGVGQAKNVVVGPDAIGDVDDIAQQGGHNVLALRPRVAGAGRQVVRSVVVR